MIELKNKPCLSKMVPNFQNMKGNLPVKKTNKTPKKQKKSYTNKKLKMSIRYQQKEVLTQKAQKVINHRKKCSK